MQRHSSQVIIPTTTINLPVNQPYSSSLIFKYSSPNDLAYIKPESTFPGHQSNGKIDNSIFGVISYFNILNALDLEDDCEISQRDAFQDPYSGKAVRSEYSLIS